MSKKYKGKICVYCGKESSTTRDHVIARQFFLIDLREGLPAVPACDTCNREKSRLEHYLTTLLPFGGQHSTALENLASLVPKRLSKNVRLKEKLASANEQDGRRLPFDHEPFEKLMALIARGLAWHHWQVLLDSAHGCLAGVFSDAAAEVLNRFFQRLECRRVLEHLGNDTFIYEGIQAVDDAQLTVWRFLIYGGVAFSDLALGEQRASQVMALTGPIQMIQQLQTLGRRAGATG